MTLNENNEINDRYGVTQTKLQLTSKRRSYRKTHTCANAEISHGLIDFVSPNAFI